MRYVITIFAILITSYLNSICQSRLVFDLKDLNLEENSPILLALGRKTSPDSISIMLHYQERNGVIKSTALPYQLALNDRSHTVVNVLPIGNDAMTVDLSEAKAEISISLFDSHGHPIATPAYYLTSSTSQTYNLSKFSAIAKALETSAAPKPKSPKKVSIPYSVDCQKDCSYALLVMDSAQKDTLLYQEMTAPPYSNQFNWDCRKQNGETASPGTYWLVLDTANSPKKGRSFPID